MVTWPQASEPRVIGSNPIGRAAKAPVFRGLFPFLAVASVADVEGMAAVSATGCFCPTWRSRFRTSEMAYFLNSFALNGFMVAIGGRRRRELEGLTSSTVSSRSAGRTERGELGKFRKSWTRGGAMVKWMVPGSIQRNTRRTDNP